MSADERNWCLEAVCQCVSINANSTNETLNIQRGCMGSARAAAYVIPLLLTKPLSRKQQNIATEALSIGITHASEEVKIYADTGVREHLWQVDPELGNACVGAIARAARRLDEQLEQQSSCPWDERKSSYELEVAIGAEIRSEINQRRPASQEDLRLTSGEWYSRRFGLRTLRLLECQEGTQLARAAYENAVQLLVESWSGDGDRDDRRDFPWESDCESQIVRYALIIPFADALKLLAPVLNALPARTREVSRLLQHLVISQETLRRPDSFWQLWQAIADRARQTTWPQQLNSWHSENDELLRNLFLNMAWDEGARHWDSLDGHSERLSRLFASLPPTAAVLNAFVTFLYSIGSRSLPQAFVLISEQLTNSGDARLMLALPRTVAGLETILTRHVYSSPAILKSQPELRRAVLHILDELVESGSSRAYRMRDDFVTHSTGSATQVMQF